jgi:hypothetical protein
MAVVRENASDIKELWRRRIRQAQDAQKPYWGTWATNLAFAAGQHWLVWDEQTSQLRSIKDFDGRYRSRELFTADRITERRQAQIGELSAEDDRPQLLAAQTGQDAEDVTEVLNDLCAYAWTREWDAADILTRARGMVLDVGYCAIRCRWNPDEGPVAGRVPIGQDGKAVDPNQLAESGMLPDGSLPKFKTVHEGRTEWELYSPFQSLTPPGIVHEKQFPWEALVKPVTIDEVKAVYGVDLDEDTDIVSTIGVPAAVKASSGQRSNNRLRDHAWLYLCYDRPSRSAPQGRELVFGGPNLELLDVKEGLPYTLDKMPHTGVVYLHWWRLSDRFQSRSFIEGQKDPQRIINRRKTQNVEIIDRSMPKLIVGKGDWPDEATGAPMEIIELNSARGSRSRCRAAAPASGCTRTSKASTRTSSTPRPCRTPARREPRQRRHLRAARDPQRQRAGEASGDRRRAPPHDRRARPPLDQRRAPLLAAGEGRRGGRRRRSDQASDVQAGSDSRRRPCQGARRAAVAAVAGRRNQEDRRDLGGDGAVAVRLRRPCRRDQLVQGLARGRQGARPAEGEPVDAGAARPLGERAHAAGAAGHADLLRPHQRPHPAPP